jgi:spermidine/putrescine transport system substrate-binding protein
MKFVNMIKTILLLYMFCMFCYATPNRLHLYIPNNYIADDTINRFEQNNNVKVVQNFFNEPEEMIAKIATVASGYDVTIATSYAVDALIKIHKIKMLDRNKIYNLKQINNLYLNQDYDPKNVYSVPYAFTPVLLGYNIEQMKRLGIVADSWKVLFEPKYLKLLKGHVTVLASPRTVFAAALLYLHKNPNTTNEKDIELAYEVIKNAMPYWTKFDSDNYYRGLMRGDIWLSMGYSEDFYKTILDLSIANSTIKIDAQLQKEGNMSELDNLVIMESSKNDIISYKFINEVLSTQSQLELINTTGASIPGILDVTKLQSYRSWMYPKKVIVFKSYPPRTRSLIDELWVEITMTCKRYG